MISTISRGALLIAFVISFARDARALTQLNMSHDLVRLGIASQNMTPNTPLLDARPLFQAAINYVQSNPVQTLTLDTGAYYLLTNTQSNAVLLFWQLSNLTVDLAGSTLYFNGPLVPNGLALGFCTNVTLANFQIDYVNPPYTHVQLTSVDTVNRVLTYQTLAGWPDPSTFNSLTSPFGGPIQGYWAAIFRNGSIVPGTTRTLLQAPFTNNALTIQDQSPWAQASTLSTLEPGDTVVVYARGGGPIIWEYFGDSLTFSNIAIYGAQGVQLISTSNSTLQNMRFAPRPGSGLVGGVGGIAFLPPGPNNHILNCYVARTLDDALVFEETGPTTVISQSGSRLLTVADQGFPYPNGTAMNFVDPGTTLESTGGIIVDQNPPYNPNSATGNVTVTFDRDLPVIAPGTFMVFGSAAPRGQGSTVEDSLVEDTYGGHGILLQGVEGVTVDRNVVRRTSMAGIHVDQTTDAAVDAADLNPPSHDVIISDNALEATLGPAPCGTGIQFCLGAIEVVSTNNQAFGFASSPANTNITVQNNYIADSGRSGIWIGELNGGTLQNNLVIRSSQNPTLGGTFGIPTQFQAQVMEDALVPVVIHFSSSVTEVSDTVSATSSVIAPVTLMPAEITLPSAGGTRSVVIQTAIAGFAWQAASDSSWLTITSAATGSGAGSVQYSVAANNTGVSRSGTITLAGETFVVKQAPISVISKAGIFRSGFYWLEDVDGNQQWDSPPDMAFAFGGVAGDIPITGDWNGDGHTKAGIYRPSNGLFILDSNGDGQFDGGDAVYNLGVGTQAGDIPVVGDWNGDGRTKVGLFRQGFFWILDYNGNGVFEQGVDKTYAFGGLAGDVPVVGDWTGTGTSKIGLFRLGFYWILDANGNGSLDNINGAGGDLAFAYGGIAGDVPVVGDWNGDGTSKVGVFRQGFFWVLDANGNHAFDGTGSGQDLAFAFGGISGDKPVVGKW